MTFFLALILAAAPKPCETAWLAVWKEYSARELATGTVPTYVRIPNGKDRIAKAWIAECRSFDKDAMRCATGVLLETQMRLLRIQLEGQFSPADLEQIVEKFREQRTVLECDEVAAALTHAIDSVMSSVVDAGTSTSLPSTSPTTGIPRSDDCAGLALTSGKCQCAHLQCMDSCCPEGWACAHSGETQSKCVRPR